MKWYKRDPDAFKGGTIGLTLEEVGAYALLLDDIYARGGTVPDDMGYCCRLCRCDPRVWRRIRARLIDVGKIQTTGVLLSNFRATSEISSAEVQRSLSQKLNENNGATPVRARVTTTTRYRERPKKVSLSACALPTTWQLDEQDADYARAKAWPPDRIAAEAERFRDHALQKDRKCKDWHAAWRNWVTSPYQQSTSGNENGKGRSVLEAGKRIDAQLKALGATDNYVPGSSGPRPLDLDQQMRPNGLRLIPKG